MEDTHHWYDQFVRTGSNPAAAKCKKNNRKHGAPRTGQDQTVRYAPSAHSPANASSGQQRDDDNDAPTGQKALSKNGRPKVPRPKSGKVLSVHSLFDSSLDYDALDVMDDFDDVVQSVLPATRGQERASRYAIRGLSHSLTDERSSRHQGYMNDDATLSPYARYFVWWNLVRLTRLFKTIAGGFALRDGDVCLDLGSGPATVPIALWLACPELRALHLTWVCQDISANALSLGKDLFRKVSYMTPPEEGSKGWEIAAVHAHIGQPVRQINGSAALVTCANVLNELQENEHLSAAEVVERYGNALERYTASGALLLVEPGVPPMARVLSLMREKLLASDYVVSSPCPHMEECPMNGEGARTGSKAKWCNFAFDTTNAPQRLRELSADAGLVKRRAVLSYLLMQKGYRRIDEDSEAAETMTAGETGDETAASEAAPLVLRIASDPIYLPGYRTGQYACSRLGLALVIDTQGRRYSSGDEVVVRLTEKASSLERDKKTGAVMLYL